MKNNDVVTVVAISGEYVGRLVGEPVGKPL